MNVKAPSLMKSYAFENFKTMAVRGDKRNGLLENWQGMNTKYINFSSYSLLFLPTLTVSLDHFLGVESRTLPFFTLVPKISTKFSSCYNNGKLRAALLPFREKSMIIFFPFSVSNYSIFQIWKKILGNFECQHLHMVKVSSVVSSKENSIYVLLWKLN